MNFEAPHEIHELQQSLRKLLADHYGAEQRRTIAAGPDGFSRPLWEQFASMGITALTVPTEHGGFGFRPADLLPVLEEFGRSLVLEPFLASCVLGATALQCAAGPALLDELMPKAAAGETILTLALNESGARHDRGWLRSHAENAHGQWLLTGAKREVLHGAAADYLLVTANAGGDGAMGLFLVSAGAAGMLVRPYRLVDETPAAEIRFEATPAVLLAQGAEARSALDRALSAGIAALAGEAVGIARAVLALTVDYLNVRQQFGRPLAANQSLRHRVAEMAVALETIRSAAMAALCAAGDDAAAQADIARAKMLVGRHGVRLAEDAVQLHGGIGMTVECGVGNYLRRMTVIDLLFGDAAHHAAAHGAALAAAA